MDLGRHGRSGGRTYEGVGTRGWRAWTVAWAWASRQGVPGDNRVDGLSRRPQQREILRVIPQGLGGLPIIDVFPRAVASVTPRRVSFTRTREGRA